MLSIKLMLVVVGVLIGLVAFLTFCFYLLDKIMDKNNTVYVITSNNFGDNTLYLKAYLKDKNKDGSTKLITSTEKLSEALIFKSKKQAKQAKNKYTDWYWKIRQLSGKILFESRLKGT